MVTFRCGIYTEKKIATSTSVKESWTEELKKGFCPNTSKYQSFQSNYTKNQ